MTTPIVQAGSAKLESILDLLCALFGRHLTGDDFDGYIVDDAANGGTERLVEKVLMQVEAASCLRNRP